MKLDDIFTPDGLLAKQFNDYEQRDSQVLMANLVDEAITKGTSAIIEGATGVGKSFAYLIPLILSGQTAIVSTSNKSLQDQLSNKDLPALKQLLPIEFSWAVLKGRNNYFCHEHFKSHEKEILQIFTKNNSSRTDGVLKLKALATWAETDEIGDIEFFPEELPKGVKELITCVTGTVHEKGSSYYDLCFANKARERAKKVNIILVNHTLLALDISIKKESEGKAKILPDVKVIIIDEAHTFEQYAVMAFSDEISFFSLMHLLNWSIVRKTLNKNEIQELYTTMHDILLKFLPEKGETGYYNQKKFDKFYGFENIIILINRLIEKLKGNKHLGNDETVSAKIREVIKEAEHLVKRLDLLTEEDENMLRWSEAKDSQLGSPTIRLKSVPLDVSDLLKIGLFEKHTVICTSATLSINKSFDFFRYQVGMPQIAMELIVDTPFNFKDNALIYISSGEFEKIWEVQKLLELSKGRAFILFTSYRDMERCYQEVDIPYAKLIQRNGVSRVNLLEDFKKTDNAVLFATKSFWEGVDVKGEKLSMVIVYKLPFESPSNLIYTSKTEKIDKRFGKGSHWSKLTIPDMCLKLKQGVGRLIRSKTDIGVIAILDARINHQNYGQQVINSLPDTYRTQKLEKVKAFFERRVV